MTFDKTLLIYPPSNTIEGITDEITMLEPLGLEYIAAAFGDKPVKILDMRLETRFREALLSFRPTTVGFSALTCHVNTVNKLAKECKTILPECFVMVGGQHATVMPVDFEVKEVDMIVRGSGYGAIEELLKAGRGQASVEGVSLKKGSGFTPATIRGYNDLDQYRFPRRDLVSNNIHRYRYGWHLGVSSIQTSVGCPFHCSFCTTDVLTKGKYIKRSIDNVISELKSIETKNIYFTDDEPMIDYDRMDKMAERIMVEGIDKKYIFYARADDIVNHREVFVKWKKIGLDKLMVGYESPSAIKLVEMNKKITIDVQLKATKILDEIGITFEPLFIVDPDFSREDFNKLGNYVRTQKFLWPAYSILTPIPGSRLYEEKKENIVNKDWDYFDGAHAVVRTKLPDKVFYGLFKKVTRGYSLLNKIRVLFKFPFRMYPSLIKVYLKARINDFLPRSSKIVCGDICK